MMDTKPTRNLALELVRVTEAASLAAGRYVGKGDKIAADHAAVEAIRLVMNTIQMNGTIVIGEGEKDEAPMLYHGEKLGTGDEPNLDIAVDPIDGTSVLANGTANAIATVALAPRGSMFNPGPFMYMDKIAVGPEAKDVIDIEAPVAENLRRIARAKGEQVEDLKVVILERDRHKGLIDEVRKAGARIRLIRDGDVISALMTAVPASGVDVLMGIGGTPEGVLAACALRALGGNIVGKLFPRSEKEAALGREQGYDLQKILTMNDLVSSDDAFFAATGVTSGDLLRGVDYFAHGARTDSLVVRGLTGTERRIISTHHFDKLNEISSIHY
ncbi:MAG: class II fructose-bisphosphatase [Anaerolineaceae bacterium]|nr:class II fructose-bisphosphatase [Anaerolineaceae bacterium]